MNLDQQYHQQQEMLNTGNAKARDPLEKILGRIRRTEDFPTISKYIAELNEKISEYAVDSSASELANIILKDYALTNKLIKLVNSAFYGFVSGKVTTVTRAVVLLGYDNVRLASLSLLLFDHFKGKSGARELKDATICSFWSGLIAKEIARAQSMMDPEEAFICALLHQLGKLMTIYHMPESFQKIQGRILRYNEKEERAVRQVLGISYHALGQAVAKQWNFPDSIHTTMVPLSADMLEDQDQRIDPLCAAANFSNDLSHLVNTVALKRRNNAVEKLLHQYENHITISPKQLNTIMASCLKKLYKHADALEFSIEESAFLGRLSGQYDDVDHTCVNDSCETAKDAEQVQAPVFHLVGNNDLDVSENEGRDPVTILTAGLQEISAAMTVDHDINDIALMSLEIIYRALNCNRALLFIHDGRSKVMQARFGYGADIHHLVNKVTVTISPGTVAADLFSQSIKSGKDLVVDDAKARKIAPLIPLWYKENINANAFLFMPVRYQKICVGAYYVDRNISGPPIDSLEHKYLSMLRNQLVLGIKMGR